MSYPKITRCDVVMYNSNQPSKIRVTIREMFFCEASEEHKPWSLEGRSARTARNTRYTNGMVFMYIFHPETNPKPH